MTSSIFLHHHVAAAVSGPNRPIVSSSSSSSSRRLFSIRPTPQVITCKAQKQDGDDANVQGTSRNETMAASSLSRRLALTALVGTAAVATKVSPADAAYGESANVFGKPKTNTEFIPYVGDGFKLTVPSKWNRSKEVEFPGQVIRFEDNFDITSNLSVLVTPTDKKSIADYGSPEDFLSSVDFLLGKQSYFGKTASEGGFDQDAVAVANILETATKEVGGKLYYFLSVLTRTADGDEGGKHQLISATVKDGKLYLCKAQAGDKRWFKGARKFVETAAISFSVA